MKILIAGGAGFIGSHLTERLLAQGHQVTVVDNLITGDVSNLKEFQDSENFTFLEHDICEPLQLDYPLDVICNLACPASPIDYQKIPLETLWVSAAGTRNMLELARQKKAVFFHTSTSEVYGDPLEHPQSESYFGNVNCLGPRSCYDEGKRFAESMIINYQAKYNLQTRIIRIFNTYGPKMRKNDGRVIPNFINQALQGEPITICGDGSQTRSFCYVDDMVDGILAMIDSKDFSGPVNLGNPKETSIHDLAEEIVEIIGSKSSISYKPLPQDDPKVRCPNIQLAREQLKFEPKIGLKEGLEKTIKWFKD